MSLLEIKKREICSQIAVYNPLSTWIVGHLWKHTKCTTSKFCIMTSQCYPWTNWRVMKTQNGKSSDMPFKLISVTKNLMCYVLKFVVNISSSHCIDNLYKNQFAKCFFIFMYKNMSLCWNNYKNGKSCWLYLPHTKCNINLYKSTHSFMSIKKHNYNRL